MTNIEQRHVDFNTKSFIRDVLKDNHVSESEKTILQQKGLPTDIKELREIAQPSLSERLFTKFSILDRMTKTSDQKKHSPALRSTLGISYEGRKLGGSTLVAYEKGSDHAITFGGEMTFHMFGAIPSVETRGFEVLKLRAGGMIGASYDNSVQIRQELVGGIDFVNFKSQVGPGILNVGIGLDAQSQIDFGESGAHHNLAWGVGVILGWFPTF